MHKVGRTSLVDRVYDSRGARVLFLVSAIVGIASVAPMLHKRPAGLAKDAAQLTTRPSDLPRGSGGTVAAVPRRETARSTLIQISRAAQSPNVNDVKHKVHIEYAPAAITTLPGSARKPSDTSAPPSTSGPSTAQLSYGAQSPNVSGVGGSVDIRYGASVPGDSGKPVVEKQR